MTDKRALRAWVKVQLTDTEDAHQAAQIVKGWKLMRSASQHVTRAIRLYGALMSGDTRLLLEYFPLLNIQQAAAPHVASSQFKPAAPPRKRETQKTTDEDLDDFLSLLK